jgi:hypothetical protein
MQILSQDVQCPDRYALARLRMKGKWLEQTTALRDGLSLTQVTERMGRSRHIAFFAGGIVF